jgi:hypothetical protein
MALIYVDKPKVEVDIKVETLDELSARTAPWLFGARPGMCYGAR